MFFAQAKLGKEKLRSDAVYSVCSDQKLCNEFVDKLDANSVPVGTGAETASRRPWFAAKRLKSSLLTV